MIQVKQGQLNFTGNLSIREHASLPFTLMMGIAPPYILVDFQKLNSGILVNECNDTLVY
jgi:hypothetical protein